MSRFVTIIEPPLEKTNVLDMRKHFNFNFNGCTRQHPQVDINVEENKDADQLRGRIVALQDFLFACLGFGSPRHKTISSQGTLCCSFTSTPLVNHYKLCRAPVIDASRH